MKQRGKLKRVKRRSAKAAHGTAKRWLAGCHCTRCSEGVAPADAAAVWLKERRRL